MEALKLDQRILDDELLTVEEVAELLSCGKNNIYIKARKGEIPSLKIEGKRRFLKSEIKRWVKKQRG